MIYNKKDKFYILVFIFSIISIVIAMILKLFGIDWFRLQNHTTNNFLNIEYFIKLLIIIVQYFLIVGSVTCFPFKKLFFKMLPFLPLTIILYCLPAKIYSYISVLILFVTCLVLMPKFSTIIHFVLNILFISIFQLVMMWLRLDIKQLETIFPNFLQMLIMNIDQFVILFLLYFLNRKRGDIYVDIFWRKK